MYLQKNNFVSYGYKITKFIIEVTLNFDICKFFCHYPPFFPINYVVNLFKAIGRGNHLLFKCNISL